MTTTLALWLTVVAVGAWHGINPAMGWPLAVANGMTGRHAGAVFATVLPLGAGHLAAMAVVLLPFSALSAYAEWSRSIRLGAGVLVLGFGVFKLVQPRHLRALARIRPSRLAWWSFLMATAHGAGLMLLPVMLGLCTTTAAPAAAVGDASGSMVAAPAAGHAELMNAVMNAPTRANLATAGAVAVLHTLAMMLAGTAMAWAVYRYLGLRFLRSAWLNLDTLWGVSLVVAGAAGALTAW